MLKGNGMANLPIIRRAYSAIGHAAAEEDSEFLDANFVDVDAVEIIDDINSPKFLLVGRTGTGKSAILHKIENNKDNVVRIDPKDFSLRFISNSNLIKLYEELDIDLHLFYEFLWRHIFAVELLKIRFGLDDELKTKKFLTDILNTIQPKRRRAFEYLKDYGEDFWLDIDSRTFEIIQKVEKNIEAEIGTGLADVSAKLKRADSGSEQIKSDYAYRAQKILDELRIQELSAVIDWLADDIFTDQQRKYFILIDDLDQQFTGDKVRYPLIKALIETIKKYRKIRPVRIIAAIRTDLLDEVFERTRSAGFQEEKFESNVMLTEWDRPGLKLLVEKRINYLFKHKYSSHNISFEDVFKSRLKGEDSFSFMISRTLLRPRDIIAFVNECLTQSVSKTSVSASLMRKAETIYSKKRFGALRDEWISQHPLLNQYTSFLDGGPRKFPFGIISEDTKEDLLLKLATHKDASNDVIGRLALKFDAVTPGILVEFMTNLIAYLHTIGVIFLKTQSNSEYVSAVTGKSIISPADIDADTMIFVHPMLWQNFNISPD